MTYSISDSAAVISGIISYRIDIIINQDPPIINVDDFITLSIGDYTIGSDNEEDSVMYPSSHKIVLFLKYDSQFNAMQYLDYFTTYEVRGVFRLNGNIYFEGVINSDATRYDYKKRSFTLEFVSRLYELKKNNADYYPTGLSSGYLYTYSHVIKKILNQINIYPTNVEYLFPIKIRSNPANNNNDGIIKDAHLCYIYASQYFGGTRRSYYVNYADVLKALCDNLGVIGWIEYENSIPVWKMLPRKKPNIATVITPSICDYITIDTVQKYDGVEIFMPEPNYRKEVRGIIGENYRNYKYYFNVAASYTYINSQGYQVTYSNVMIDDNNWGMSAKSPDGIIKNLWQLVIDDIWGLTSKNRKRLKLKLQGVNYKMSDYLNIEGIICRIKQIKYDYIKNICEVDCIEAN